MPALQVRSLVIAGEIIVIIALVAMYLSCTHPILVHPLARNAVSSSSSRYKYFYEPTQNLEDIGTHEFDSGRAAYRTSVAGFRGGSNYDIPKPADTFRIITLGDSFTFGVYLDSDETFPFLLEQKLNRVGFCGAAGYKHIEVVNFGVPGYDIPYAAERLRLHENDYQPDLIVWFIKHDDFGSTETSRAVLQAMGEGRFNSATADPALVAEFDRHMAEATSPEASKAAALDALHNVAAQYGKSLLVYAPQDFTLDILPVLTAAQEEYDFQLFTPPKHIFKGDRVHFDSHPTLQGTQTIADHLFRYLIEQNPTACPSALPATKKK